MTNELLPQFSIIVPTYNRATTLGKTIKSVLEQTYTQFELIIVDDGSSDNTNVLVNSFSDFRIRYFYKLNGERGAARNFGLEQANGKYVNFLDSDDRLYPNHLATAMVHIQRMSPSWFHLGYDFQDLDGNVLDIFEPFKEDISRHLLFDNKLSCNGVFIRRDIAKKFKFCEDRVLSSSEDWELWIRLSTSFCLSFDNTITSSVVLHSGRSLNNLHSERIINRDLLLIRLLQENSQAVILYGEDLKRFIAERYTFFMLSLSREKRRPAVLRWAIQAVVKYPKIVFTKRFLASLINGM